MQTHTEIDHIIAQTDANEPVMAVDVVVGPDVSVTHFKIKNY